MGCCISVLASVNSWTSAAPQIDKPSFANTGKNVEDLENALDALSTENEALKRELSDCIHVLRVVENFLQLNNITAEDLMGSNHKAESSSAVLRNRSTQDEAFSVRDSIRAAEALTDTPRTAQLKQEVGLLCDVMKKVCLAEFSSLTLAERLKLDALLTQQSKNKETEGKAVQVNLSLLG